jgi:periodic tryptophan protein 2
LSGHKDTVIASFFHEDSICTVSRDGSLLKFSLDLTPGAKRPKKHIPVERLYFNYGKVVSVAMTAGVLGVGFASGMFGIWMIDSFDLVGVLSISQHKIDTVSINATGEWLAFGSKKLGQLLVWEWQSESYVLKQQVF